MGAIQFISRDISIEQEYLRRVDYMSTPALCMSSGIYDRLDIGYLVSKMIVGLYINIICNSFHYRLSYDYHTILFHPVSHTALWGVVG